MRKLLLIGSLITLSLIGRSQNRTSSQSGDWNLTSTWGGLSVPDQSFGTFGTVTLNHTVTVRAASYTSSNPLRIDQVVINGTGALVVEAGAFMRIQNGTGNDITVNSTGTIVISGTLLTNTGVTFSGLSSGNTSFNSTAELRASSASIPLASGYNQIPVFIENVTAAITLDASWSQLTSTTDLTVNCPALGNAAISFNGQISQLNSLQIISTNGSNAAGGGRVIIAAPAAAVTNTISITGDVTVSNDSRLFISNGSAAGFVVLNIAGNLNYNSTSSGTIGFSQLAIGAGTATINFSNGNFAMGSGEFRFAASGNNGNGYLNFSGAGSMTVTGGVISENGGGTAQGTISFLGSGTSQAFDVAASSIGTGTINMIVNKSSGSATIVNNLTVTNTTLTSGDLVLTSGNTFTTTGLTLTSGNFILSGASVSVLTGAISASNGVVDATVPSSLSIGATGTFSGPILFKDASILTNLVIGRAVSVQSNPSSGNLTANNLTLSKGLTMSTGTFSISDPSTPGLVTVTGGILTLGSPVIPLGVYDLTYNNAVVLTTGDELSSSSTLIRNFTKQGSSSVTLNKDLTVNGNFLLNAGTFTASTFSTTLNGSTNQISSTATFAALNVNAPLTQATGTATRINGNLVVGSAGSINFTAGTTTFGGSTIITNNGIGSIAFKAVAISGALTAPSGTISVAGNLSGTGTFNSNGGTVVFAGTTVASGAARAFNNILVNNGASLSGAVNFSVLGDLVNNGTINCTGGTLTWNSNGSLSGTPTATTLSSVTVSASKTLSLTLAADIIISGTVTLNGAFQQSTSNNITIGANLAGNGSLTSSGTVIFTGLAASMAGTGTKNFQNLSVTGKLTIGATTSYIITDGVLNVTGTLATTATTTGTSILTIAGNTTIASTGVSTTFNSLTISGTLNATGTINLNRHFTNNGIFNSGGGTVAFTNPLSTITQSIQGTSSSSFDNVIVASASSVIFSKAFTVQSSLTLNSGIANNAAGVLSMNSGSSLVRNGTSTMTGVAPSAGPYDITYNGSSYSNGVELLGNVNNVNSNLTGTLSFANAININGTLTVAAGVVDCGVNLVTLGGGKYSGHICCAQ